MYSQNQEELYIINYFGDFVGTFADIGCNDCETFSNTRALALRGWKGIFVDCSPRAIERCKKLYKGHKGMYSYDYALRKDNGKDILQDSGSLIGTNDVGLVSTFHQHEKERFQKTVKYEPVEVKMYTWRTALNRWKYKKFDMISIDIEGCEMEILPDIDLTETRCVCIEWNGHAQLKEQFSQLMPEFRIIYTSGENLLFAR